MQLTCNACQLRETHLRGNSMLWTFYMALTCSPHRVYGGEMHTNPDAPSWPRFVDAMRLLWNTDVSPWNSSQFPSRVDVLLQSAIRSTGGCNVLAVKSPVLPPTVENFTRERHDAYSGFICVELVCFNCRAEQSTNWKRCKADCYGEAKDMGWSKPNPKPWTHSRCPQCRQVP